MWLLVVTFVIVIDLTGMSHRNWDSRDFWEIRKLRESLISMRCGRSQS